MVEKNMICIVCPIGCHLKVQEDKDASSGYKVTGNKCKRGENYAIKEMTNPTRVITSTVKIKNGFLSRLPVKTSGAIPKNLNFECMKVINSLEVEVPIKVGDILVKNILNTGIDLVASRSMK